MRVIAMVLLLVSIMSFSLCWAQDAQNASVQNAYNLYYKGQKQQAIDMMKEYIKEHPDPEAFYFLGYAYYEMDMQEEAAKYFNEAFVRSPFYSPIPAEEKEEKKEKTE